MSKDLETLRRAIHQARVILEAPQFDGLPPGTDSTMIARLLCERADEARRILVEVEHRERLE